MQFQVGVMKRYYGILKEVDVDTRTIYSGEGKNQVGAALNLPSNSLGVGKGQPEG